MPFVPTHHLDTPEQSAFRRKARDWMAGRLPPRHEDQLYMDWEDADLIALDRTIQRTLWDGGLAGITVPEAYGGQGLDGRFEAIFYEEAEPYRLPWHFGNAFLIALPVLLGHASEMLKQRYIPAMLRGDELWCQLFSEPSGGSDLAGVLTRAERRGDHWVLNGSKVWTTGGSGCDMGICLARTDPTLPKHAGLTMFVVDMHAPGVTINPIKLIAGGSDFCQEYFDDVPIPDDHVVGAVNDGWTVTQTQLAAERAGVARGWHVGVAATVESPEIVLPPSYIELARSLGLADDPHARQLVGEAFVVEAVNRLTNQRIALGMRLKTLPPTAGGVPGLIAARAGARRTALLSELAGPAGVAAPPGGEGPAVGISRVTTHRIGGGTMEMQLNSVSERYLGLPREPGPARDMPFNQLRHNAMPGRT